MKDYLHFDPITLLILVGGFIATWATLKRDNGWHTKWIESADRILVELQKSNEKLTVLTTVLHERVARLENQMDRKLNDA